MSKKNSKIGVLHVITGPSGSGKDAVVERLLQHPTFKLLKVERIITCTDRPMRSGEINHVHYHFISKEKLIEMNKNEELVEEITLTGTSNKATTKKEIERLFNGDHLIWLIDPSRAAQVAKGEFFNQHFSKKASLLQENTIVICVTAPKRVIDERRKKRDGDKYKPEEYLARDKQEKPHLDILQEKAILIENIDGHLEETVNTTATIILNHHEKIKK